MDSDLAMEGGSNPVLFTDPDLLECLICVHPLSSPIYQCENGHIACSSCCNKTNHKCPFCCSPIGFIRCLAMEKIIESLRIACKNKRFGCKETLIYHQKSEHENTCPYTACFCPLSSCTFANSSKELYSHFSNHHESSAISFTYDTIFFFYVDRSQTHIILQEQNEGVIFVVNHCVHERGRVFNVDCIGPSTFDDAFVYQLTAKYRKTILSLESIPEVWSKWQEHAPNNICLTIPSCFSQFVIQVCIKKAHHVVL